jgi:hypothetical protein
MELDRISRRLLAARLRPILTRPPEPRTTDNVPVACPIEPEAMQSYIEHLRRNGLADVGFDPCLDCEFFRSFRLGEGGTEPTRDVEWYDYGLCMAPDRPEPVLVAVRPIEGRARKVTDDDPDSTDAMVLRSIDAGANTVRLVVEATALAERTVFKVLARLRYHKVIAPGVPLRRLSEIRTRTVVSRG